MKILHMIILGAPGSGKGTISERIIKRFGINHISSGDILRKNIDSQTDIGKVANDYVKSGRLVPDEVVHKIVQCEIAKFATKPWLLDGYPRTVAQANLLSDITDVHSVINLIVPFEVIIERLKSRWVHLPSGRVYNLGFNDPKVPGKDNETGENLVQREDDKPEAVSRRLEIYSETIGPVVEFYQEKNVLNSFKGSTTNEIWPQVEKYICEVMAAS